MRKVERRAALAAHLWWVERLISRVNWWVQRGALPDDLFTITLTGRDLELLRNTGRIAEARLIAQLGHEAHPEVPQDARQFGVSIRRKDPVVEDLLQGTYVVRLTNVRPATNADGSPSGVYYEGEVEVPR